MVVGRSKEKLVIRDTRVDGTLTASDVGGFVGVSEKELLIENCTSSGRLTGTNAAGFVCSTNGKFVG